MGVFGKNSHGNESSYNQGFDFVSYLAESYGDSVLKNIVVNNSKFSNWTFESSFSEATGRSSDEIYQEWLESRKMKYDERLADIRPNIIKGQPIEREGFANLFPRLSPEGDKVAYISNKQNDYWSQNRLILKNLESGDEKVVDSYIASGPVFSPDGKYIAYTKMNDPGRNDSHYQDIFIYNVAEDEEYQVTRNLRARQLDWSQNDELVFVISQDGTGFLYKVNINLNDLNADFQDFYIKIHGGTIEKNFPEGEETEWPEVSFKFQNKPELLSNYIPGRQFYKPRWSADGSKIVYAESNGYTRSITYMNMKTGEKKSLLNRFCDDRDPDFSTDDKRVFFASDSTGLYNIYSCDLQGGNIVRHTNVVGGAFMPHVVDDKMVYALYDSLGYKIHYFPEIFDLASDGQKYIANYSNYIPEKNFANVDSILSGGKPYRAEFSNIQILPRIFFDYGTFKPGIFIMNSDPLDKWMFFGGVAFNFDWERDIYLYTAYNGFKPTVFLEFFNITQNLSDVVSLKVSDIPGDDQFVDIPQDLFFNLIRASTGLEYTMGALNLKGELIYNKYDATITNESVWDSVRNEIYEDFPLSYTYLKGPQLALSASWDSRKRDRFTDIAPRGGRYIF